MVGAAYPGDHPIDGSKEPIPRPPAAAEQKRREGRRKGERVEKRDRHRASDRERELTVEFARRPGKETGRYEDGAGDLARRMQRTVEGVHLVLLDVARDVLDDYDRIVDDEPGCERQPKERQRVDREIEELHQRERPDQGNRDRDRRDERDAPIL